MKKHHTVTFWDTDSWGDHPRTTKEEYFSAWQEENRDVTIIGVFPTISMYHSNARSTGSSSGIFVHYTKEEIVNP